MSLNPPHDSDLVALTAELVDIPSVSHDEEAIASFVESRLESFAGDVLSVARIADNVCARTDFGLPQRLVLAGHLDTVPPNGNEKATISPDEVSGLGSVDMKGGVAVFMEIARAVAEEGAAAVGCDLTFLFYACEEVDRKDSGLLQVQASDSAWLEGDAAVLGEPTAGLVEAGCQGVLRLAVECRGKRAHTARPWMGDNAIHQLGGILRAVDSFEARSPVIDGCKYREALQAVAVSGGVAGNVVPDSARLVLNHRFAPDRSADEAFEAVSALVRSGAGEGVGSIEITLQEKAAAAAPSLSHPLLAALVSASGAPPRAKLGWTDVSFFSARGVPAANVGPGDSTLAHTAGEVVGRSELDHTFAVLAHVVSSQ